MQSKHKRRKASQRKTQSSFLHLFSGSVIGQLFLLAALPLISRLYDKTDFGILASVTSLWSVINIASSLSYENAIPVARSRQTAAALIRLSCLLLIGFCLALAGFQLVYLESDFENSLIVRQYGWLVIGGILLIGLQSISLQWVIRVRAFGLIAKSKLYQSLLCVLVQSLAFQAGPQGLILGQLMFQTAGLGLFIKRVISDRVLLVSDLSLKDTACSNKDYPIYDLPQRLINILFSQLPVFMIMNHYGASFLGLYFFASKIVSVPVGIILASISQIYLGHSREWIEQGILSAQTERIHRVLIQVIGPLLLIFAFIAPVFFPLLFGQKWQSASVISGLLCIGLYVESAASPWSVFTVLNTMRLAFGTQVIMNAIRFSFLILGIYWF